MAVGLMIVDDLFIGVLELEENLHIMFGQLKKTRESQYNPGSYGPSDGQRDG